jgi:hypothetical protein
VGQEPAPLECDRQCAVLARRAALADAFGVTDPDSHVPYWDKHRSVSYSHALLTVRPSEWGPWLGSSNR